MSERIETGKYLHAIAKNDEYIKERQAGARSEHASSAERIQSKNHAIRLGALALAHSETRESGYRSPEGAIFNLIAHVDSFSKARDVLDSGRNLSREQKHIYKKPVIEFNHALKEAIDSNPSTGFNAMLTALRESYASINGVQRIDTFTAQAREVLVGMQHERAAEQIIGVTEGFEVDYDKEVTIDDELEGIDLFVRNTETGESFGIDFKSSPRAVERARNNAFDYGEDANKYVWSQCTNDDFDNTFKIPLEVAKQKAEGMKQYLTRASATSRGIPARHHLAGIA